MRKILIAGKDGQVGWELQRALAPLGKVYAYDRASLDLGNPDRIREVVRGVSPQIIVNAAAYTAVDRAEVDHDEAMRINAVAPAVFAEEAKKLKSLFVHYSTDYVFDGTSPVPYREKDPPNPLNVYGKSKWEGEKGIQEVGGAYLILRTSWVYGLRGKNFLLTMLRLGKERELLRIVDDQIGAPTWSRLIAEMTSQIIARGISCGQDNSIWGTYHLTSLGETSWFGFAEEIFKLLKSRGFEEENRENGESNVPHLEKIGSAEYPLPAVRPKYSVLSNEKLLQAFSLQMPDWKEALSLCMDQSRQR